MKHIRYIRTLTIFLTYLESVHLQLQLLHYLGPEGHLLTLFDVINIVLTPITVKGTVSHDLGPKVHFRVRVIGHLFDVLNNAFHPHFQLKGHCHILILFYVFTYVFHSQSPLKGPKNIILFLYFKCS